MWGLDQKDGEQNVAFCVGRDGTVCVDVAKRVRQGDQRTFNCERNRLRRWHSKQKPGDRIGPSPLARRAARVGLILRFAGAARHPFVMRRAPPGTHTEAGTCQQHTQKGHGGAGSEMPHEAIVSRAVWTVKSTR